MSEAYWVEVGEHRTFVKVQGPDSGQAIVLVPGLGCSHRYFAAIQRELAKQYRVVAYDPPGFGYSPGRLRQITQLSDHLAGLLEALELRGAVLFGHSLGGEVVVDMAVRHPGRVGKLVLCAPTGIPDNPNVLGQFVNQLRNIPNERMALFRRALPMYLMTTPSRIYALALDQQRHRSGRLLSKLKIPVMLITGTADPVINPRSVAVMQEAIPKVVWLEVKGGTHALHDSHAAEVAKAVGVFIQQPLAKVEEEVVQATDKVQPVA